MDPFNALFAHAAPSARSFFAGNLCTAATFAHAGHLHVLRAGVVTVVESTKADLRLTEPTLLFYPRTQSHGFKVRPGESADLICARVDLGGEQGNPVGTGLPERIVLPIASHPPLQPICDLLVIEAFADGGGRQVALDRLFEYLLIVIVRLVVAEGAVEEGALAGLADPRLCRALTAMHDEPRRPWTLDTLSDTAGMSRTRFAARFRAVVGRTPLDYLAGWRMTLAQRELTKGKPVKAVATAIGYKSPAAFARAYVRIVGHSPREAHRIEEGPC